MIKAINTSSGKIQDVGVNDSRQILAEANPKYRDLGEIFNGDLNGNAYQLAANAFTPMQACDELAWVRNIIFLVKATNGASCVAYIRRRDTAGVQANSSVTYNISGNGTWDSTAFYYNTGALIGASCSFQLKNIGASAADFWLRVQLLG